MHEIGTFITCLYLGVFSWSNGDEYLKQVGMRCEVEKISVIKNYENGQDKYMYYVNCYKSLITTPNLVKGHKINLNRMWVEGGSCYTFDWDK